MKSTRSILCAAALLAVLLPAQIRAEEPEAPGYEQCMQQAVSTVDIKECLNSSYEYWDGQLNASWKQLMTALKDDPATKKTIREAQRQWVKYKEAQLKAINASYGGTWAGVVALSFLNSETKKQTLQIQGMLENF